MSLLNVLTWFSGIAFIYFGINCLVSPFIKSEFKRYGLANYRILTGILQLVGAMGILIGLQWSNILLFSAALGLAVLMLAGFIVRIKIKDNFVKSSPAFVFAFINTLIAIKTWSLIGSVGNY